VAGPADWVVFSGAGLSVDPPAGLPAGNRLRDDVLAQLHSAAARATTDVVSAGDLDDLRASPMKLEVVLGRLWGTIGDDALDCLLALHLDHPNAAHLLAALHLAHGGTHVTLNLDVGIEIALDLLLAPPAPGGPDPLAPWRALLPEVPHPPLVVASQADLQGWWRDGQPPALLKVHGSLARDQSSLVDPVVVDIDELAQLTPARRAAVDACGSFEHRLVTGYAGEDIDVYTPLLEAVVGPGCVWRQRGVRDGSPVPDDVTGRGARFLTGDPDGLAVTGLADALDVEAPTVETEPGWSPDYPARFSRWVDRLTNDHPDHHLAMAYAWLISDDGDYDTGVALLEQLEAAGHDETGLELRLADLLYQRSLGDDRARAARRFRQVASTRGVDAATRAHALLRLGDHARGELVRKRPQSALLAVAAPAAVLLLGRRLDPEIRADALRALQQLVLRLGERAAAVAPRWSVRPLAAILRAGTWFGERSLRLARNGNRRSLVAQHRLALLVIADLAQGRRPPPDLVDAVEVLRQSYEHGGDRPGVGNCLVVRALHEAASGEPDTARSSLAQARDAYRRSRPKGTPTPSGVAFADVAERLIARGSARTAPT
jgi:hypothetical protein